MKTRKECGEARSKALTADKRKEIATKAAQERWKIKIPKATHQGILFILGKKLPCVVLEDGTRIIQQKSVFKAFDRPQRGLRSNDARELSLPSFLDAKNLRSFLTEEIQSKITLVSYINSEGVQSSGYRAEIIPVVCDIYLSAKKENCLTGSQAKIAEISELLLKSLAQVGIIGLIDEATGYQQIRPRDALEAYLNKVLSKELATWCKRFPDEYYSNIYRIRKWPEYSLSKNKYSCVGTYTNDIVYSRLGSEILQELKSRTPDTGKVKMHQWLSVDTGHPLLSEHMRSIITLQRLAIAQGFGWKRFVEMVDLTFPKKQTCIELLANPV